MPFGASSRRDARADGPDGERARAVRPDRGVRRVRGRRIRWRGRAAVTVRPARDRRPRHRRDRRRVGRRPAGSSRPPAPARGAPLPAPPWLSRARRRPRVAAPGAAVADRARGRRPARPRDVAVDLPARPKPGQRDPDRAPGVPRRLTPSAVVRLGTDDGRGGSAFRAIRAKSTAPPARSGAILPPTQRTRSAPGKATRVPPPSSGRYGPPRGSLRRARCRCVPIPRTSR